MVTTENELRMESLDGVFGKSMMQFRFRLAARRLAQHFEDQGNEQGRQACGRLLWRPAALRMFAAESTITYATATGIAVAEDGQPSRPFLDFLERLIERETFRGFMEWLIEHADEILEIVLTIIGMF